jgi:hypothetical protein
LRCRDAGSAQVKEAEFICGAFDRRH